MSQTLGPPQDPIAEAIRAGKFSPARRPHYERLMAADPVGTRQLLAELAPVIPVDEIGQIPNATPAASVGPAEYPRQWLNRKEQARGSPSRVVTAED